MPVQYVNRKDVRYYLLVGKTKTGKPKYYCSKQPNGTLADAVPEGFELHESPRNGAVSVRRIRSTRILPFEREQLASEIRKHARIEHFIVDVEGDSLVVYLADTSPGDSARIIKELADCSNERIRRFQQSLVEQGNYSPMLRFTLSDPDERLYSAERWCFRGSIDGWVHLVASNTLPELAKLYGKTLGSESFFELF